MNKISPDKKYRMSFQEGTMKECIYDGLVGKNHCFTTKKSEREWEYYFLAERDFTVKDSGIEVLANQPRKTTVSRELEPIEFLQIQQSWRRAA